VIEFFLSKLPLAVAGLLVAVLLTAGFVGLDSSMAVGEEQDAARQMAQCVRELNDVDQPASVSIRLDETLPPGCSFVLCNGSAWVINGERRTAAEIPVGIHFFDEGMAVGELRCERYDTVVIRRVEVDHLLVTVAYLAKV
jgi:hypothetical protein